MNTRRLLDDLFVLVRNIPFSISLQPKDEATQITQLLQNYSGGCTAKHCLLSRMLRTLGLKVKLLDFPFYWQDQDFLPADLQKMAIGLPLSYHLACQAMVNGYWLFLDASWDQKLANIVPINDSPFIIGNICKNAVTPHDEPTFYTDIAERQTLSGNSAYSASMDKKIPFYSALNDYLNGIRVAAQT